MEKKKGITLNSAGQVVTTQDGIDFVVDEYLNKHKSFTQISKEQGCSEAGIRRLYHYTNNPVRTDREQALRYTVDEDFFEYIDTSEKAYWLGFWYADGYIIDKRKHNNYKVGCSLSVKDIHHLEKFKKAIRFNGPISTYTVTQGYKVGIEYCRILITSDKLAQDLIDKGCSTKKTDKLVFPSVDKVPEQFQLDFIRGLIDGDGSIVFTKIDDPTKRTYSLSFTGTKEICDRIAYILMGKTITLTKRHKERDNNNYTLIIGGNIQVARLLKRLYDGATIYLDRKYERYLQVLEYEIEAQSKNPKRHSCVIKPVRCIETGEIFDNCALAAQAVGLKNQNGIIACLHGKRHKAGNCHWEWVD